MKSGCMLTKKGKLSHGPWYVVYLLLHDPDSSDSLHSPPWTQLDQRFHRLSVLLLSLLQLKLNQVCGPMFLGQMKKRCCETRYIRAKCKIQSDGGDGIGPARVCKSAEECRKGGRAQDNLVDNLVIESKVPKPPPHSHESRLVVYCIGCDKMVVGRDAQCIRNHAKDCDVCFVLLVHQILPDIRRINNLLPARLKCGS